jgi:hypothetical protein
MTAIGLQIIALVAVVLSFLFAALVFMSSLHRPANAGSSDSPSADASAGSEQANDTMERILADVEKLATLRERGVLTDKEFAAQKTKLLQSSS